jgi:hypothetical protein
VRGSQTLSLAAISRLGSDFIHPSYRKFSQLMLHQSSMTSRTAAKDKRRRTTMVPVTTMEEIPVLSETERADLLASLKRAEKRVKAGKGIDFDSKSFKRRLIDIYRGDKR